jgi:hypothetical protein
MRLSALRLPFYLEAKLSFRAQGLGCHASRERDSISPLPACGERSSEARVRGRSRESEPGKRVSGKR